MNWRGGAAEGNSGLLCVKDKMRRYQYYVTLDAAALLVRFWHSLPLPLPMDAPSTILASLFNPQEGY